MVDVVYLFMFVVLVAAFWVLYCCACLFAGDVCCGCGWLLYGFVYCFSGGGLVWLVDLLLALATFCFGVLGFVGVLLRSLVYF